MLTFLRRFFSGRRSAQKSKCATRLCKERICRECGYDLRGAAGDPVRCPECGTTSSLAGLLVVESRIAAALNHLEGLPVLCVACVFFAMVVYAIERSVATPWGRIPVASLIMVCWVLLVFRYARDSSWGQGWHLILILFHLIGFLGVGFIALLWWSAVSLLVYYGNGPGPDFGGAWGTPACTGALSIGALFTLIPFLYRKAKKLQSRYQRQWAIRLGQRRRDHPRRGRVIPRSAPGAGNL